MTKKVKSRFATLVAVLAAVVLMLPGLIVNATESPKAASPDTDVSNDEPAATASDGRPLYTEETRPNFPVFNSLIGEEHFLSITGPDGHKTTSGDDALELQLNQQYDVVIQYDNNGLPQGIKTRAYANDARVKVSLPLVWTETMEEREMVATISANNTKPTSVSDILMLATSEPMELEIVPDSTYIVNQDPTNGDVISASKLLGDGVLIGTNNMVGIVLYGPEHAGEVVFSFRTVPPGQSSTVKQMTPTIKPDQSSAQVPKPSAAQAPDVKDANHFWQRDQGTWIMLAVGLIVVFITLWAMLYYCRKQDQADN